MPAGQDQTASREILTMSYAICVDCGAKVHWRAKRGTRLEDQRCPHCGGKLRGKTAGQPGKSLGRRMDKCIICGRKGFVFLRPREPYKARWPGRFGYGGDLKTTEKIYPAGSPCCWHGHAIYPADPSFIIPETIRDNVNDPEGKALWQASYARQDAFDVAARQDGRNFRPALATPGGATPP